MAKKIVGVVRLQVPAGAANPAPPIGPALGSQGVIGFVGGDPPVPMKQSDVDNLKRSATEGASGKPKQRVDFNPGDRVKITDGPFMSFSGIVQEVDPDQGKLNVLVSIFGRDVQVELEASQVERDESKAEEASSLRKRCRQ